MTGPADELINQLNNFATRKAAKIGLVALGEQAVEPLGRALTGPLRDNVKWNVIDILARIGSVKAVPALEQCAQDPTFETVCREAVRMIRGEVQPVPAESSGSPRPETAAASSPDQAAPKVVEKVIEKVVERVVEKVVEVSRKAVTPAGARTIVEAFIKAENADEVQEIREGSKITGFKFYIPTDQSCRRQRVNVYFDTTDEDGRPVICIYSICCEAKTEFFENALKWNRNIASGSLCITDHKGKPFFVLIKHLGLQEADGEMIPNTIRALGSRADTIEKVLTGVQDIR